MTMKRALLTTTLCFLGFAASPAQAQRVCPDPFNAAPCTPVTASATGTTGAITATLPAVSGKTTYICGFQYMGTNATAANPATNVTITGTISGTLNFGYPTLAAAATVANTPPVGEVFTPCIQAAAINTAIVVNGPVLGAGATLATVSAWGFQL
jgi:hypothetical protein